MRHGRLPAVSGNSLSDFSCFKTPEIRMSPPHTIHILLPSLIPSLLNPSSSTVRNLGAAAAFLDLGNRDRHGAVK